MRNYYTLAFGSFLLSLLFSLDLPAQTPADAVVPITVTTTTNPASIKLSFPATANATTTLVARKLLYDTAWGYVVLPATATSFTDNSVVAGVGFEYMVIKQTSVAPTTRFGLVYAGIQLPAYAYQGKVILVVDNTLSAPLAAELTRFAQDLRGDGWQVIRHDINVATSTVPSVKALIKADYVADPFATRAAFLIGNIPVPYSGEINPDGHDDHIGAWPTDYFYADMDDNAWTDNTVNNTSAARPATHNVPGDGKFDQSFTPTPPEIVVSRLDFSNLSGWSVSQTELYRRYMDKNHKFRTAAYKPDNKTLVDDNFGYTSESFAQDGWRNGYAITGSSSVIAGDFFNDTDNQNFLIGYGCGGGTYTSANGVGTSDNFKTDSVNVTFSMLFGSYFGDWDYEVNPFMPSALASKGGILTCAWAGRPHWMFHHMDMGEPILTSTLWMWYNSFLNSPVYPSTTYLDALVHVGMLGDPTLRAHNVQPPQNVAATASCTNVKLDWTASADAGLGYLVYRAPSLDSIFDIISPSLITGTSFIDSTPLTGQNYYQVKLFKLENVPTGSYYNQSVGTPASATFTPGTLAVTATAVGASCNGGANGTVSLGVTGGMNVTYLWSNGYTGPFLGAVGAGVYSVTVTSQQGCTATASATVTQPPALLIGSSVADVSCFGLSNGHVDLNVTGGQPPYQYLWSNNNTTASNTNLPAGPTSVTVTDVNGCTKTFGVTLTEPTELLLSTIVGNIACFGAATGSISLSASGGTPGYVYHWSNNANTAALANVAAGTYTVTTTDANGCTKTTSATVTQPTSIISATSVTNAGCAGATNGGIDLTVSGGTPGYTFKWSNGSTDQNLTNVAAGTYTVTITDNAGCTRTNAATVQQITTLAVQTSAVPVACFGGTNGSVQATPGGGSPGYTFAWSNNSTTAVIANLVAGTYTVTLTDAAGCSQTATAIVAQPTALSAQAVWQRTDCTNTTGNVTLSASGGSPGYTYQWSTGAGTPNLLQVPPAQYTVTITDQHGCSITATNTVVVIPPIIGSTVVTGVTCFGGSNGKIDLTVIGGVGPGYSYLWSSNATTQDLQNIPAGAYTVTITDQSGCTQLANASVDQPAAVIAALSVSKPITCFGGSDGALLVSVTGGTPGYTYTWSNGSTGNSIGNLGSGVYSVTATDSKGCTGMLQNAVLTDPPPVQGALVPVVNAVCAGEETVILVDTIIGGGGAPYTYSVNSGPELPINIPSTVGAGAYTIAYFDKLGCSSTETLTISAFAPSGASIAGQDTACLDIPAAYSLPGNFSAYQWVASNNGTIALGQGTNAINALWATQGVSSLAVYFTNSNGCPDTAQLNVFVDICVGTQQPDIAGVTVQPNPFRRWLTLRFDRPVQPGAFLRLVDVNGRLVATQTVTDAATRLETAHLPAGTYVLQIVENNRVGVWKVVKME